MKKLKKLQELLRHAPVMNFIHKHALSLSMLIGFAVTFAVAGFVSFVGDCETVADEVLRLHILANSNSAEDQQFKYALRDCILEAFADKLGGSDNLEAAIETSLILLPQIEEASRIFAAEKHYNTEITAEITQMYFPTRVYEEVTLPAGKYTALRLTVGDGEGDNWWCVMFPAMCVPAVSAEPVDSETKVVDAASVVSIPDSLKTSRPKVRFAVYETLSGVFRKQQPA